ncbi:daptide-type RiPP biosynthesis methyltransferase [Microbacterium sp. SLBN-146]|uniref:daptide-type RiPP biosynthesis methyltransferase n=1 Tax=Microbacterium sp. SLBN-146 TaxID=2768457 RepID=UPI00114EC9B4|nr:daptide-type RiPP biosynthesis methyltransferase [Microbacterium sp. SLBN-146]TQJ30478.1 methyltransferase family protein [Microbacterium sp. SLBN-146]
MEETLTTSLRARLAREGAYPRTEDLYSAEGARFYDDLVGGDRSEVREFVALARACHGRVLDLAAGGGRITLPLLSIRKAVTALDLSFGMLDLLRQAAPANADLEVVHADMRDFRIDQRFDLIVLGATSITLLDPDGRRRLFDSVRHHLAPDGRFALSVAGFVAAQELQRTADHTIAVTRAGRNATYLSSQEVVAGGSERIVNFVELNDGLIGPIFTTRLQILDDATISRELVDAGFEPSIVHPVRTPGLRPGDGIVILESSWQR